jgi:hypothetical protein
MQDIQVVTKVTGIEYLYSRAGSNNRSVSYYQALTILESHSLHAIETTDALVADTTIHIKYSCIPISSNQISCSNSIVNRTVLKTKTQLGIKRKTTADKR